MQLSERLPIKLNDDYASSLHQLEYSNDNFLVTGKAGTGKSTLLQLFKKTTKKRVVVLAPTGIAALNVKGQTIHSFFKFPPRLLTESEITKSKNASFFKKIDTIVIDEISMVRADLLDNIDYFLRINRNYATPFGGVQMVFFGDIFQLPPVVSTPFEKLYFREKYESQYFFSAKVFEYGFELKLLELSTIYRQDEKRFIKLLDSIRHADVNDEVMEELNERKLIVPEDEKFIIQLCARNATADNTNRIELEKLSSSIQIYTAKIVGNFPSNIYPVDANLALKEGTQIMFVRNDQNKDYVNGTIGKVLNLTPNNITVEILDEGNETKTINVSKVLWENITYKSEDGDYSNIKTEVIGTFEQFPIKLAWAITIHKSQGKTFNKVIIDLGSGAFESGQTYVALSRCRRLDGLYLKSEIRLSDIILDPKIVEFYDIMRRWG